MNPPLELKSITPYLQRAKEIKAKSAVVAYFCLTYAVKKGIDIKPLSSESRSFLSELMDKAEKEREALKGSPEIASDDKGKDIIIRTANDVFSYADNQEKAGNWTKGTALAFLAASNFYEVVNLFEGQLQEEYEQKIKYARYKAADIHAAIKAGKRPESAQDSHSIQPEAYIPPDPSAPVVFPKAAPNLSPLSSQPHYTPPTQTSPSAAEPTFSPHNPQFPTAHPHQQPLNPPNLPPQAPAHHYQPVPPSNSYAHYQPQPTGLPAQVVTKATKHARHAISALQFDDAASAVANLQSALNELMPFHH